MPIAELIVIITLAIACVIVIALALRAFNLRSLHRTVTVAIEQNSPEVPALIARIGQRPRVSLRLTAYVLLAIAIAIVAAGALEGNLSSFRETVVAAMFPAFVGAAILLYLRAPDRAGDA